MSSSYPDPPVDEVSNAKFPDGYTEVTGTNVWTWDEATTSWVVTARPDKTTGYGE